MDYPLSVTVMDDFIVALKPSGFPTHRTDIGGKGFIESLEEKLQIKLFLVHRLDKDVSGLILVARSQEVATELRSYLSEKKIVHRYIFKTQRRLSREKIKFKTFIEKQSTKMVSIRNQKPNSETLFTKVKSTKQGDIWSAIPKTGKTHQIRLHAKDLKIRIDGDKLYGGTQNPTLCLQSQNLEFEWRSERFNFTAPPPVWQDDRKIFEQQILESIYRRRLIYETSPEDSLRLVHTENLRFRLDQFGSHWWVYWEDPESPTPTELQALEDLATEKQKRVILRDTKRFQKVQTPDLTLREPEVRWVASELGIKYELRSDQGISPGLYLDQRINRNWVKENSHGKKVLSLFSFTGSFSINAALGQARVVTSVDVSPNFIAWSKHNFKLNGLNPDDRIFQFANQDVVNFLKGQIKTGNQFDLIICDPPAIGRIGNSVFQIQKDWQNLLNEVVPALAPGGRILFTTNYERWSFDLFFNKIEMYALKKGLKAVKTPLAGLDFEPPQESPLLKSVFLVHV